MGTLSETRVPRAIKNDHDFTSKTFSAACPTAETARKSYSATAILRTIFLCAFPVLHFPQQEYKVSTPSFLQSNTVSTNGLTLPVSINEGDECG